MCCICQVKLIHIALRITVVLEKLWACLHNQVVASSSAFLRVNLHFKSLKTFTVYKQIQYNQQERKIMRVIAEAKWQKKMLHEQRDTRGLETSVCIVSLPPPPVLLLIPAHPHALGNRYQLIWLIWSRVHVDRSTCYVHALLARRLLWNRNTMAELCLPQRSHKFLFYSDICFH